MILQDVQYHVLGHPHGEIIVDDAHDWHLRKLRILKHVVDTGAEREDGLEIGKTRERAVRRPPHRGILDVVRIADALRPQPNIVLRAGNAETLVPTLWVPPDNG